MRSVFLLILATAFSAYAYAQRTAGLTHRPDTSFTNYSAFKNAVKRYPQIKLVKDTVSPNVRIDKDNYYFNAIQEPMRMAVFSPRSKVRKRYPAIIIIHGGGWRSGTPSQHFPLAERLAEKGFICFVPAYRLSTVALYPAAVEDLKLAIRMVRTRSRKYEVDSNKVAVLGFSAGGQLAALLGATGKDTLFSLSNRGLLRYGAPVQAIVDIDGILAFIHPESAEGDDSKSVSAATNWFGYTKTQRPDLWKQASALTYAGPSTPPTLFINSSVDRMHAGRQDYIDTLNKYHIYTEVHSFPDSPHPFCLFEPWFTPTVNYITDFLDKVFADKR